jgi:HD-GYP domain-containing protein (c-di-GMP phosphodiesterase class II)
MDGKGYPDGLTDPEIPPTARIIAVADTYDAMTTSRPYRAGLPPEHAAAEILASTGSQFCPRVVAAFRSLFEGGRFNLGLAEGILRAISDREPR